ncbi:MAG: adenosylcobinamide-GDP ribazoletransferase [Gammaproteobacteria bacterium]|nr:MAG: adenosylcobinamide-GDP ribazoletransferase [Gammaproteobacteria bacterium]
MLKPLFIATQLMTRFPVPRFMSDQPKDQGRAVLYFPLIGLLIGAILYGLQWVLQHQEHILGAVIILIVWVGITGGLHLDGLGDSADGWLGGHGDRDKTLAIMKDSRSGVAAIVCIVLLLFTKFVVISLVIGKQNYWPLLLAPMLGRLAVLPLFLTTTYARPGGMGETMQQYTPRIAGWLLTMAGIILVIILCRWQALIVLLVVLFVAIFLRWLMKRNLNGITGDTTGAYIELVEASALIGFVIIVPEIF